jgi:hypothetical protein
VRAHGIRSTFVSERAHVRSCATTFVNNFRLLEFKGLLNVGPQVPRIKTRDGCYMGIFRHLSSARWAADPPNWVSSNRAPPRVLAVFPSHCRHPHHNTPHLPECLRSIALLACALSSILYLLGKFLVSMVACVFVIQRNALSVRLLRDSQTWCGDNCSPMCYIRSDTHQTEGCLSTTRSSQSNMARGFGGRPRRHGVGSAVVYIYLRGAPQTDRCLNPITNRTIRSRSQYFAVSAHSDRHPYHHSRAEAPRFSSRSRPSDQVQSGLL